MKAFRYGIDALPVIGNLALAGAFCLLLHAFTHGTIRFSTIELELGATFLFMGISFATSAVLMLLYGGRGKLAHRDRLLALVPWRGHEQVLDVGTGRGLLLVGAAQRAPMGHVTGIDIWNAADLSGNSIENAYANAEAEGVRSRTHILNADARAMPFADASFDVVLSNLCLHNIPDLAGRRRACQEIARVLRPGGTAVLSDFRTTGECRRTLEELGWPIEQRGPHLLTTFPPLTTLVLRRPASGS
ncbi:class I SAM-dependent methyltransferase [Hymenobacter ruricola]|uniref:Class I SAM-dependent methyltransferase n=1 Tax=Hymenobacter ruricola TaxID=2791023 RepID=A0ABS0I8H0_9BACT|nr:class I SAM-dependent methyltransferase [Hymenobacter ruricola]MBF9222872.1 class I SAM-dependent methyltransferase [Hymenobacter ruricola]